MHTGQKTAKAFTPQTQVVAQRDMPSQSPPSLIWAKQRKAYTSRSPWPLQWNQKKAKGTLKRWPALEGRGKYPSTQALCASHFPTAYTHQLFDYFLSQSTQWSPTWKFITYHMPGSALQTCTEKTGQDLCLQSIHGRVGNHTSKQSQKCTYVFTQVRRVTEEWHTVPEERRRRNMSPSKGSR